MEPLFTCRAVVFVHEFILCNKKARKDGQADVDFEVERGVRHEEHKEKTGQNGECIERVSNALPFGQIALDMEIDLINANGNSLNEEGE
jgi:hypothetical protein